MAELKGRVLGNSTGKIGNIVTRRMSGKTFVSVRPGNYKLSGSAASVDSRNAFAAAVKFAKCINSDRVLHKIWLNAGGRYARPYNQIIKFNLRFISEGRLNKRNLIVPDGNITVKHQFGFHDASFSVITGYYNFPSAGGIIPSIDAHFVIALQKPLMNFNKPVEVFGGRTPCTALENNNGFSFSVLLNSYEAGLIDAYAERIFYYAVISENYDRISGPAEFF